MNGNPENISPTQNIVKDETFCPSCGRFVGPVEICPYCTTHLKKRTAIKVYKIISLILAIFGTIGVYYISKHRQIPLVRIDEINPMMNFAYVRIHGKVTRVYPYDPQKHSLAFVVNDGSEEELRVSAYRREAEKIVQLGLMPDIGDEVEVAGSLSIRENFRTMYINMAERMKRIPQEIKEISISEISRKNLGDKVRLNGVVLDARELASGIIYTLGDPNNEDRTISMPCWRRNVGQIDLPEGTEVTVVGSITEYRNEIQITPNKKEDIVIKKSPISRKKTAIIQEN